MCVLLSPPKDERPGPAPTPSPKKTRNLVVMGCAFGRTLVSATAEGARALEGGQEGLPLVPLPVLVARPMSQTTRVWPLVLFWSVMMGRADPQFGGRSPGNLSAAAAGA